MSLPIVLLPGSLCDDRVFAALDLGEHSIVHADLTSRDSIGGMAQDVLADAPERFIAIGLSLGAIVAAEIAGLAPERVAGLALLDTNLAPVDPAQVERRERWQSDVRAGLLPVVVEEMVPSLSVDPITRTARRRPGDGDRPGGRGPNLRHRTVIVVGLVLPDPVFVGFGFAVAVCPPALHAELVAYRSDAELVGFDGAGHLVTLDQPEALSSALRGWITTVHTQPTMEGYST